MQLIGDSLVQAHQSGGKEAGATKEAFVYFEGDQPGVRSDISGETPPPETQEPDSLFNDLDRQLDELLGEQPETLVAREVSSRAEILQSMLTGFTLLPLQLRERLLPKLYNLIMRTYQEEGKAPSAFVTPEVIDHLIGNDREASSELKEAADLVPNSRHAMTLAGGTESVQLFLGPYEVVVLGPDGAVRAHSVNREGDAIQDEYGTLTRYALIKALLGHHTLLILERKEGDWPKGTDNHDNTPYFTSFLDKEILGLIRAYVGNIGRTGASGAQMTDATINRILGRSPDHPVSPAEKFTMAGAADREFLRTMLEIAVRRRQIRMRSPDIDPVEASKILRYDPILDLPRLH